MTSQSNATLRLLSESGQTIAISDIDVRGRKVKDKDGKGLGMVHDLVIDDQERQVRFLLVEHGGFLGLGHATSFIPVEAITEITPDDVVINHTREHVAAAPPYHPGLVSDRGYHGTVYAHYGYSPYWGGAGYPWSGYIGRSTM